ncbi:MAG: serine hydrolase domain-containing protein [Pseudomonadota bacterium]
MYGPIKVKRIFSVSVLCVTFFAAAAHAKDRTPEDVDALIESVAAGLRPLVRPADAPPVRWTMEERMAEHGVPGVSVAVIEDGRILFARGFGVKNSETMEPVDENTVFSVGSVSKVGAAATALRLVAKGELDLDAPVNRRLTTWQVPDNEFTERRPVTLRGLLSHTAGLTVHGFPDFKPGEKITTAVETLNGSGAAKTPPVRPFYAPGTQWRYSGGGTTVMQLLISESTGGRFEQAAAENVFAPLGMGRSTYENPLPASHGNIAYAHNERGGVTAKPRGWHTFPEKAASGLWTTPSDVAKLYIALMNSYGGDDNAFLPRDLAIDMMTEVSPSYFGLGPALTGFGQDRRFFHSGANESYRAWTEGHLETRNGLIVFTNGAKGSRLYYEIRRAVADAMGWPYYEEIITPNFPKDDALIQKFIGTYTPEEAPSSSALRTYGSVPVKRIKVVKGANGGLQVVIPGRGRRTLHRVSPTTFLVEDTPIGTPNWVRIEFLVRHDSVVKEMILTLSGEGLVLSKK